MTSLSEQAPDFTLENTAGAEITLSETLERAQHHFNPPGPTVLLFLRGYWCSYCAEQLQTFDRLEYDLWRNYNVDILPIAGDSLPALTEMRDRHDLGFELLSDPDLSVTERYTGIEDHEHYGQIPHPGTYIVDTDGVVQYEHIAANPSDRTYANYVRHAIWRHDGQDPYPEE